MFNLIVIIGGIICLGTSFFVTGAIVFSYMLDENYCIEALSRNRDTLLLPETNITKWAENLSHVPELPNPHNNNIYSRV